MLSDVAERLTAEQALPESLMAKMAEAAKELELTEQSQRAATDAAKLSFLKSGKAEAAEKVAVCERVESLMVERARNTVDALEAEAEAHRKAGVARVLEELRSQVTDEAVHAQIEPRAARDAELRAQLLQLRLDDETWRGSLYATREALDELAEIGGLEVGDVLSLERIGGLDARIGRTSNEKLDLLARRVDTHSYAANMFKRQLYRMVFRPGAAEAEPEVE